MTVKVLELPPRLRGGTCPRAPKKGWQGVRGKSLEGQSGVFSTRCGSWVETGERHCVICRENHINEHMAWLFRCMVQWCDPLRLPPTFDRIQSAGVQRGDPPNQVAGLDPELWALHMAFTGTKKWEATSERLAKLYKSGLFSEWARVKFQVAGSTSVLSLVAVPPDSPVPEMRFFKHLRQIDAEEAVRAAWMALNLVPKSRPAGVRKISAVRRSRGWMAADEDEEEPLATIVGTVSMPKFEAVVKGLGGRVEDGIGRSYREVIESVKWDNLQIGTDFANWIAIRAMDRRVFDPAGLFPDETPSVDELVERVKAWHRFIYEHKIENTADNRRYLERALRRYPGSEDAAALAPENDGIDL